MMNLIRYPDAGAFLADVRPVLEMAEAANNLMYGLALTLERDPNRYPAPPYLSAVGGPNGIVAAALMTPPYNLVVLATEPEQARSAFDRVVGDMLRTGWHPPGVVGPNEAALAFSQAWQVSTSEEYSLAFHERVYELVEVIPPPRPSGEMRPALDADLELCARWLTEFQAEAMPQERQTLDEARSAMRRRIEGWDIYLWDDGGPVALAGRTRPTPHGYTIGPVYTPPEHRRKGYATALTADLSQLLLDMGKQFVTLFTDLANPTSNSIYMKVGFRPVCDFDMYRFQTRLS
jgi:hypothetical protein